MSTVAQPPSFSGNPPSGARKPKRRSRLLPLLVPILVILVAAYFPIRKGRLNEALYKAVVGGDMVTVHRVLEAGADPNLRLPNLRDEAEPFNVVAWIKSLLQGKLSSRPNNQRSMLMVAASKGDGPIVEDLLAHGADQRVRLSNGSTALLLACHARKGAAVKALLDHGADLRQKDKDGLTPLLISVREGGRDTVGTLLDHGANANELDPDGMPVLYDAVRARRHDVVSALLRHGADVAVFSKPVQWHQDEYLSSGQVIMARGPQPAFGAIGPGGRPMRAPIPTMPGLTYAAEHGSAEVLEAASRTEWGVREFGANGGGLLTAAVVSRRIEAVDALLKAGVPARNPQALCAACRYPNGKELAELLLRHGAAVDAATETGETPLLSACRNSLPPEFVNYLIARGANPRATTQRGETALILGVNAPELVKLFLSLGIDVKARTVDGESAMSRAYNTESIRLLAAAGADVNDAGLSGETPLMRVASNADAAIDLLKRGADVHIPNRQGETAISRTTSAKAIQALLEHGADANELSQSGMTPLMSAVWRHDRDSVAVLLKHGADPNTPDRQGQTPLAFARKMKMAEIASLLEAAGAKE
jgi:ankyrin repeat protein